MIIPWSAFDLICESVRVVRSIYAAPAIVFRLNKIVLKSALGLQNWDTPQVET